MVRPLHFELLGPSGCYRWVPWIPLGIPQDLLPLLLGIFAFVGEIGYTVTQRMFLFNLAIDLVLNQLYMATANDHSLDNAGKLWMLVNELSIQCIYCQLQNLRLEGLLETPLPCSQ